LTTSQIGFNLVEQKSDEVVFDQYYGDLYVS